MNKLIYFLLIFLTTAITSVSAQEVIRVYNYGNFISPEVITDFEKQTGIKVEYRTYDTDYEVSALFASNTVADIIIPSHFLLKSLIANKKIKPLDKSKITNYSNLNPDFLIKLQEVDNNNQYAIPYLWLVTGLAINEKLAKKELGDELPYSWGLIFNNEYRTKLSNCGISLLEAPLDFYDAMLNYQGINIDSVSVAKIKNTNDDLSSIRKSIKSIDQYSYIDDLQNNNLCVSMAYSGDVIHALNNNSNIKLVIPDNHALLTIDTAVIPSTAKNIEGAHAFINYLLTPRVAAKLVNATGYGTAVLGTKELVQDKFKQNEILFPERKDIRKFTLMKSLNEKQQTALDQVWASVM